jgi:segregation and condensation protein A
MALPSLWQSSLNYKITTDVFEGPLDLLLQLIENAELDITKVSLARVTDQYLTYLRSLVTRDPVEVSAFLVIAAKLVFIKSSILLPSVNDEGEEQQEDIGEQLARQLVEYKQFKNIADWLSERQASGLRSYYRVAPPPIIVEHLDISDVSIYDLIDILMDTYFKSENETAMSEVVSISPLTIKNRIQTIKKHLRLKQQVNFSELIAADLSRLDVVVTFLALLELVKNHAITALQESLFSDIAFERTADLDREFELEL